MVLKFKIQNTRLLDLVDDIFTFGLNSSSETASPLIILTFFFRKSRLEHSPAVVYVKVCVIIYLASFGNISLKFLARELTLRAFKTY